MSFSLLDLEMNGTCDSMNCTQPYLINVATLLCESQKTTKMQYNNGILPKIIVSDVSQFHQSRPGSSCALNLLIWGVIQQCVY